jgi:O-antigen/teichoic acid export membrane protein
VRDRRLIGSSLASARPAWLREWAGDSALLLFSQVTATMATSVLAILIARSLGPHDWGIFSGFLGLSLALAVFAEFGLSAWVLRELSHLAMRADPDCDEAKRKAGQLVGGGFLLTSLLGAVFIVGTAAAAIALALNFELSVAVVSLVAYSAVRSGSTSLEAFFRSRRKLRRVVAALLIEKGVLLILIALLLLGGAGLIGVALAYPIAGLIRLLVNALNILARKELTFSRTRLADLRHVARGSMPFALNRASLNVVPRLDAFALAALSPIAAGYFALGNRILGPALILPMVISSTLYPFLARESRNSRAGWAVVALLTAVGLALAGVGVLAAPFLVPLLFGSEYRGAVPAVQVMLFAMPFVFAANPLLAHVYTSRREGRGLVIALAAASVVGTGAILAGQLLSGPLAAASGYLLRQALFAGTLVVAARLPAPPISGSHREGQQGIPELSHAARSAP